MKEKVLKLIDERLESIKEFIEDYSDNEHAKEDIRLRKACGKELWKLRKEIEAIQE